MLVLNHIRPFFGEMLAIGHKRLVGLHARGSSWLHPIRQLRNVTAAHQGAFEETPLSTVKSIVEVNLLSYLYLTHVCVIAPKPLSPRVDCQGIASGRLEVAGPG